MTPLIIDLNCDMGEGIGNDALIMPYITSANIACGLHAGDDDTMKQTIELALQYNVAIGAHPSFNDRENFGRKEMVLSNEALSDLVFTQVDRLKTIAATFGAKLHHVKPHGALYNMAARNELMSRSIAGVVKEMDAGLIIYGLCNTHLITEANNLGLTTAAEVFADRTYSDDGSLTPRSHPGALIEDEERSVQQVLQMVIEKTVTSTSGKKIHINADTLCIHGDGIHAVHFAVKINETLKQKGIDIKTI